MTRAVVTLAVGKPLYVGMAVALARSFKVWHAQSDIKFAIATDRPELIPSDLRDVGVIPLTPGQFGTGFTPKLYVDQFAPADQTMFVDSDCLCVGSLETAFERLSGRPVSVVGGFISDGEWFGDVAAIRARFGLPHLVKFNGGLYYMERGAASTRIYETARGMVGDYDEIGFLRLRGKPNEELLMAVAMAVHGAEPLPDDGTILADLFSYPGKLSIDVLRGVTETRNPRPPHEDHRDWNPHEVANPAVVHFLGAFTTERAYRREARRLALTARGCPILLADIIAAATISLPMRTANAVKDVMRPLYRRVFGFRAIPTSPRV